MFYFFKFFFHTFYLIMLTPILPLIFLINLTHYFIVNNNGVEFTVDMKRFIDFVVREYSYKELRECLKLSA